MCMRFGSVRVRRFKYPLSFIIIIIIIIINRPTCDGSKDPRHSDTCSARTRWHIDAVKVMITQSRFQNHNLGLRSDFRQKYKVFHRGNLESVQTLSSTVLRVLPWESTIGSNVEFNRPPCTTVGIYNRFKRWVQSSSPPPAQRKGFSVSHAPAG